MTSSCIVKFAVIAIILENIVQNLYEYCRHITYVMIHVLLKLQFKIWQKMLNNSRKAETFNEMS